MMVLLSADEASWNLSNMLSLSNKFTNFDFRAYWTQIVCTGFFVFVMSQIFMLKY